MNAGRKTAIKLLQVAVNANLPSHKRIKVDGVIGPKTIEAVNSVDADKLLTTYALLRIGRYREIVLKNPSQRKFLLGWINRVFKEIELCSRWLVLPE